MGRHRWRLTTRPGRGTFRHLLVTRHGLVLQSRQMVAFGTPTHNANYHQLVIQGLVPCSARLLKGKAAAYLWVETHRAALSPVALQGCTTSGRYYCTGTLRTPLSTLLSIFSQRNPATYTDKGGEGGGAEGESERERGSGRKLHVHLKMNDGDSR